MTTGAPVPAPIVTGVARQPHKVRPIYADRDLNLLESSICDPDFIKVFRAILDTLGVTIGGYGCTCTNAGWFLFWRQYKYTYHAIIKNCDDATEHRIRQAMLVFSYLVPSRFEAIQYGGRRMRIQ